MTEHRFAILWRGVVLGEECGNLIPIVSKKQLRQWGFAYENDPEVEEFVLWDREENRVSDTVKPFKWEDQPDGFEESWSDVKTG